MTTTEPTTASLEDDTLGVRFTIQGVVKHTNMILLVRGTLTILVERLFGVSVQQYG